MSALARLWRPKKFTDLIGQDVSKKALISALDTNRIHQAYLFSGPSGIGKTTIARLFAKALNCEQGTSSSPCLTCSSCLEIDSGNAIDVIEIDGASNTKVEDTREILNNIAYLPVSSPYKIYIIDEVHMLSQHSFNALLKTLEEPPAHVIFLLATTDPQKLPITVLSRCLQFHLKSISNDNIVNQLIHILSAEKITYENEALEIIAKAAEGSMRDALSLLDHILLNIISSVDTATVANCLGFNQHNHAEHIIRALSIKSTQELINIAHAIDEQGGQFYHISNELLHYFHQLSIYQCIPEADRTSLDSKMRPYLQNFSAEELQLFYQIVLKGKEDMALAPALSVGFQMMLLRLALFRPFSECKLPEVISQKTNETSTTDQHTVPLVTKLIDTATTQTVTPDNTLSASEKIPSQEKLTSINKPTNDTQSISQESLLRDWEKITDALALTGLGQSALSHSQPLKYEEGCLTLAVNKGHVSLFTPSILTRIQEALTIYLKKPCRIFIEATEHSTNTPAQQKIQKKQELQKTSAEALNRDPLVQQLTSEFSAELQSSTMVF